MVRKKLIMSDYARTSNLVFNDSLNFQKFMQNNLQPVVLELACGKGAYVIELAKRFPQKLFIGIDVKADRLGYAARIAKNEGLTNAYFINMHILDLLEYFEANTIEEIWITFADPHPKPSKSNKRLTAQHFLGKYAKLLKGRGLLHIKTDSQVLYDFSLEELKACAEFKIGQCYIDLYNNKDLDENLLIKTPFEQKHLQNNLTIKYVLSLRK